MLNDPIYGAKTRSGHEPVGNLAILVGLLFNEFYRNYRERKQWSFTQLAAIGSLLANNRDGLKKLWGWSF